MTNPTFVDHLLAGGGNWAAVFHIGGLPWAATTSPELAAWAANTGDADVIAYRKELFGLCHVDPGGHGDHYASQAVQVVPTLSADLGSQALQYDDSKGITGGGWGVKISRTEHGAVYNYRTDGGTPSGIYAGLDIWEDPSYDATVYSAILADDFDSHVDTTIIYGGDGASLLHAYVLANDVDTRVTYLWAAHQVLAATNSVDNGDGTYTVDVCPGAFRAPHGRLFASVIDGGSVLLTIAPSQGVVGRPAYLWLVPMCEGVPVFADAPIMFRCGAVANNPAGTLGTWAISCRHYLDWLDVPLPAVNKTGMLQGYRFTRGGPYTLPLFDNAQMPHLMVHEWDPALSAYVTHKMWLTEADGTTEMAEGTAISFDTLETLFIRAQQMIIENTDLIHNYECEIGSLRVTDQGLETYTGPPNFQHTSYVTGPLAWILGWGHPALQDFKGHYSCRGWQWWGNGTTWHTEWAFYSPVEPDYIVSHKPDADDEHCWRWVPGTDTASNELAPPSIVYASPWPITARYYYQHNWLCQPAVLPGWDPILQIPKTYQYQWASEYEDVEDSMVRYMLGEGMDEGSDYFEVPGLGRGWPVPEDVGDDPSAPGANGYRLYMTGATGTEMTSEDLISVGASQGCVDTAAADYVLLNETPASPQYLWSTTVPIPILRQGQHYWGADLFGFSEDPWPLTLDSGSTESDTLTEFLMSTLYAHRPDLFGGDYDVPAFPERRQATWIPDLWGPDGSDFGGVDNYRQLVDWLSLDALANTVFTSATFSVSATETSSSVRDLFFTALLTLGIRPCWEYSETQRAWWLTFRTAGIISNADAQNHGRDVNETIITASEPVESYGRTWLFRDLSFSASYNGGKDPAITLNVANDTALACLSSGGETLTIDDHLTNLSASDESTAATGALTLLRRVSVAGPTVSFRTTIGGLAMFGVGSDILLTSPAMQSVYSGSRGLTKQAAMVVSLNTTIGAGAAQLEVTARLATNGAMGLSPSMLLASGWQTLADTTLTIAGADTDPADNDFAPAAGGMTDLATFGCFYWDAASASLKAHSCTSATGFRVWLFRAGVVSLYSAGANQNVWAGVVKGSSTDRITLADVAAGACRIELDDVGNFQTAPYRDLIMIFADRDHAALDPHQLVYGWLGDETGRTQDSAGTYYRAMSWS